MQRLFSSFADGWPGVGLLIQRILAAGLLFRLAANDISAATFTPASIPSIVAASAGVLLLAGLWTPIVGTLIAVMQIWLALLHPGQPWLALLLGTLGATISMIGPGAWSIDARLFGRKHIHT